VYGGSLCLRVALSDRSLLIQSTLFGSHLCRQTVFVRALQVREVDHPRTVTCCVSAPRSDVEPGGRSDFELRLLAQCSARVIRGQLSVVSCPWSVVGCP